MMYKKSISSIVALLILIFVAVFSINLFNTWFKTYSSNNYVTIEENQLNSLDLEGLVGDYMYIRSNKEQIIDIFKIFNEQGELVCWFDSSNINNFSENTRLLLSFDNDSIQNSNIKDFSKYNYSGVLMDVNVTNFDGNLLPQILNSNCINGECLSFDGRDDMILINPGPFPQKLNSSFSGAIWLNSNQKTGRIWERSWDNFNLEYSSSENLFSRLRNSTSNYLFSGNYPFIELNKWYFVVSVYNKELNTFSIYVNGNLINSNDASNFDYFLHSGNSPLNIGSRFPGYGGHFNGTLDEMVFYTVALSDGEIKSLYKLKKALFYEQILFKGIKKLDISKCNLIKGKKYNLVIFTNSNRLEKIFIR